MQKSVFHILFMITGAIVLLIPAFDNNFPFVYPDTGAYIASGFNGDIPIDRPIAYGLFLRHISLKTTLWLPVFLQSLIVFYLIYLCVKHFIKQGNPAIISMVIAVVLVSCTGVGYYTGQLMPDIFSGILIVAVILLVFTSPHNLSEKILVPLIILTSMIMHVSNIMFMLFLSCMLVLYFLVTKKFKIELIKALARHKLIFILTIAGMLLLPTLHYLMGGKFVLTRNSHVFLTAKFCESGLLEKYLKDNCNDHNYTLCAFKDNLPKSAMEFIWSPQSPFLKSGGWENSEKEYTEINSGILFGPKYWKWIFSDAIKSTLSQFFTFSAAGGLGPQPEGTAVYHEINHKMHHELNQYIISRQSKNYLDISNINRRQFMLVILSLLVFLILIFGNNKSFARISEKKILVFVIVLLLINAFICGTFANVYERLQARVVWVLPLFFLIVLFNFLSVSGLLASLFKQESESQVK